MLGETGGVRRRVGGNWSGPVVGREQSGRRELREKGTSNFILFFKLAMFGLFYVFFLHVAGGTRVVAT